MKHTDLSDPERRILSDSGMLLSLIQGYVGISPVQLQSQTCTMAIISRLSCKRAGTRFNARGVDDDGYVSNFVEVCFSLILIPQTELLLLTKKVEWSYLQLRGSVPCRFLFSPLTHYSVLGTSGHSGIYFFGQTYHARWHTRLRLHAALNQRDPLSENILRFGVSLAS